MEKDIRRFGLTANQLRFLALGFMLLDHMYATVVPGNFWMTCVGRMAFPIFAFQISEGFLHTSNAKRYAQRLLMFALVAEIPFNLMLSGGWLFPFHQNVLFTLLLGLLAIGGLDKARKQPSAKNWLLGVGGAVLCVLLSGMAFVDYGWCGVLTVILFYLLRDFPGAKFCQLGGLVLVNFFLLGSRQLPVVLFGHQFFFPEQGFAVFALVFIWLYNGQKGRSSKMLQYAAYAFYPVHALVLTLVRALLWG